MKFLHETHQYWREKFKFLMFRILWVKMRMAIAARKVQWISRLLVTMEKKLKQMKFNGTCSMNKLNLLIARICGTKSFQLCTNGFTKHKNTAVTENICQRSKNLVNSLTVVILGVYYSSTCQTRSTYAMKIGAQSKMTYPFRSHDTLQAETLQQC